MPEDVQPPIGSNEIVEPPIVSPPVSQSPVSPPVSDNSGIDKLQQKIDSMPEVIVNALREAVMVPKQPPVAEQPETIGNGSQNRRTFAQRWFGA